MVKVGGYKVEDIYQGGYDSFKPNYGPFIGGGIRVPTGQIGAPTKPDTANQIAQVNALLNQGIVPIEVGALSPDVFDQIPKDHFKEINRMAKLTGAKISVHAPLMEASGLDQQAGWSEENRVLAERRFMSVIDKTFDLDENGRIPIVMHSANIPGTEWKIDEKGNKVIEKMIVVDRESGRMTPIEAKERYYPSMGKDEFGKVPDIYDELKTVNHSQWDQELSKVEFQRESAERIIENVSPIARAKFLQLVQYNDDPQHAPKPEIEEGEQQDISKIYSAHEYMKQASLSANGNFNKAYKYGTEEDRKELLKVAEEYKKMLGIQEKDGKMIREITSLDPKRQSDALFYLNQELEKFNPNLFVQVEEFAKEKSSQTFANVAWHAFEESKKRGIAPPKIGIENVYPGIAHSMGDEMAALIEASRKNFIDTALKKGLSQGEAEKAAKDIIGMTFDVGHLNIAKKHGFTDKDLVKEAEKFAKYVKHVHLTDNFGYSDSHLAPGMGNVPFKEHLEVLEKAGVLGDTRKIVEASGIPQHFGISPYPAILEGMGSPIYGMKMGPYWNQTNGLYQGYFGGYGMMLPQTNYETWGAGFSRLPSELGGSAQGAAGSRMSGRPME